MNFYSDNSFDLQGKNVERNSWLNQMAQVKEEVGEEEEEERI